jgi:O-antigen ligase
MFVLVDILFVSFISIEKNKRKRILKKIGPAFGVVIAAFVIVACIPTVRNRFAEGIEDISYTLSGNELDPYHGTFTYRMWLFSYRIQYLKEQHKLLFGLGPISSRNNTAYFGNGTLRSDMSIVYNPDNSYMTLLPRYGILGTLFYVGILIILAIRCYKNKTKLSVATAMHIICSLFQGMIGNAALCEYSLMVIGLLVGMCMAEKQLGIKSLE